MNLLKLWPIPFIISCSTAELEEPQMTSAITITIDDAPKSTFTTVFPILEEYGLTANVALPVNNIGNHKSMTKDQLDILHLSGWSIISHTMNHPDLRKLSEKDLYNELISSRDWIRSQGYNGSEVFVVPSHKWGERERQAIKRVYRASRGLASTIKSKPQYLNFPISDPYSIVAFPADKFYTTTKGRERIQKEIQKAIENNQLISIYFHDIKDPDSFRKFIEMVSEFEVLPYHRIL